MQIRFGLTVAVLLVAFVSKGHSELQCYVCDNCAKIDKNTPLQSCGAAPAVTTTTMSTTSEPSTTAQTTTTTTQTTTETPTTTTGLPTPPTIGPLPSTTAQPTPPNIGTVLPIDVAYNYTLVNTTSDPSTRVEPILFVTPTTSIQTTEEPLTSVLLSNETSNSTLLGRLRRYIPENGMTYHCYKVQKKYESGYGIERGCLGVETQQSVCGVLSAANQNQTRDCKPCSKSMCNGSSTIGVSIATLLLALVALAFKA